MKHTKSEIGILLFTLVGAVAFGINLVKGDVSGKFELEDIQGNRAVMAHFPLEGYGGDAENSFRFSIANGQMESKHYGWSAEKLGKILEAEENGTTSLMKYFYEPAPGSDVYADTAIIVAEDANTVQEDKLDESLEVIRNKEYAMGETIRADKVDVFCTVEVQRSSQRIGIGRWSVKLNEARFDTGLSLADQEYFFTTGAGEEGYYDYDNFYDNYTYIPKGKFLNENRLKTYEVQIGQDAFVVVAPDERCEGQTYVYKVDTVPDACLFAAKDNFWDTVHFRDQIGKAEPLIPVPDFKEARIIGLDAIPEKELLLLSRLEGNTVITDVYNTKGVLLGSGKTEGKEGCDRVEANIIPWEDGVSVDIRIKQEGIATGSKILLWIADDNTVEQVARDEERDYAIVHGNMVLYLDSAEKEEKMPVTHILGKDMPGVDSVVVYDRNSNCLYQGKLHMN